MLFRVFLRALGPKIFFAGLRPAPRWGSRPRPPTPQGLALQTPPWTSTPVRAQLVVASPGICAILLVGGRVLGRVGEGTERPRGRDHDEFFDVCMWRDVCVARTPAP